jgi:hypothetical protein
VVSVLRAKIHGLGLGLESQSFGLGLEGLGLSLVGPGLSLGLVGHVLIHIPGCIYNLIIIYQSDRN